MTQFSALNTVRSHALTLKATSLRASTGVVALSGALAVLLLAPSLVSAEANARPLTEPDTGSFPDANLSSWKQRSFNGKTKYELVRVGGATVLKGSSNDTASVLYKEKVISLKKTPWVNWSWRVENTLGGAIKEKTRAGDDFPARMYVVVSTGFMPWENTAINYVWSSLIPIDTSWVSPFTTKSIMVALQSGDSELGVWKNERRNVAADFKEYFDMDIDEIDGYAVMVDSDNTDQKATAYFGNINFSEE